MAEIIRMPRLSDTMEEGVIVSWLKSEGDKVSPGDILAEVETDKATMDLESFYEGTLIHIGVKEGVVPVDGIIAIIGDKDEDVKEILANLPDLSEPEGEQPTKTAMASHEEATSMTSMANGSSDGFTTDERVKASPLAKNLAKEAGINLASIQGTGDHGRIIKRDVESYKSTPTTIPGGTKTITASSGSSTIPVSQMRKTIAKRLSESKFTIPHYYLTVVINMDNAYSARKYINDLGEGKISFNDIVVKACALALKKHAFVNAAWEDDQIRLNHDVNIGVAVAVDEGLLVPVIHHADQKPMREINAEVRDKAERARNRKLSLDEMQGNNFTISNLGMFGIQEFTAIINPPDSCILAVGAIEDRPVIDSSGAISKGRRMNLTLSCDHRVVDGATGAKFLQTLKAYLEEPLSMMA